MASVTANIYILIPIHNRQSITLECLKLLNEYHLIDPPYQVVIIDDGSTDGSAITIERMYPSVKILTGDGSLWWTGAICKGMEYAYHQGSEFIIWLNDDCKFSEQTLPNLVSFCQTHLESIIGCQVKDHNSATFISYGGKQKTWKGYRLFQAPVGQVVACDLLCGNIVCFPRNVIDRIGYPDLQYTPHYGGDSLYLIKAQKKGFSIYVDARTSVFNTAQEEPNLYPRNWLLTPGAPLKLIHLVFTPQSGLSWRVWLSLNWQAYSLWGIVMFIKKYSSILLLTGLRFLPYSIRCSLSVALRAKNRSY
jgi:glycosyltransferase involved in cell wall biosynthesis